MFKRELFVSILILIGSIGFAQSEYPSDSRYYNPSRREVSSSQESSKTIADNKSDDNSKKTQVCHSHENFRVAYEFLIGQKDQQISESKALEISLKVSEGCEGSAQRFIRIYETLKKSGVALNKAIQIALEFSALDDERAKNFMVVFQKMYLENYYDFDFPTAYHVSFELSRDMRGNIHQIRDDFVSIVGFCIDNKKMGLPLRTCAQLSIEIAKLSPLYPMGVAGDFKMCYEFLRNQKKLGLSQIDALKLLPRILKNGPQAFSNFQQSFEYATTGEKIHLNSNQALQLGLKLASYSMPLEKQNSEKHE